jgi:hypothetical protein
MQSLTQSQAQAQAKFTYPAESMAAAVAIAGAHNLRPLVPSPLLSGTEGLELPNGSGMGRIMEVSKGV